MSWFDTKNFASLAKSALKEAQRKIDQALDIQDEESGDGIDTAGKSRTAGAANTKKLPGGANRERSHTEPSTPAEEVARAPLPSSASDTFTKEGVDNAPLNSAAAAATASASGKGPLAASAWGSFTGSFFENPKANEMVTTPPKASGNTVTAEVVHVGVATPVSGIKRQSVTSNSDSVELLSSPISPASSELATPSDAAAASTSASVDLLTSASSAATPTMDSSVSLPDSIVIIASNDGGDDEEEDDSVSFNTVLDDNDATMLDTDVMNIGATEATSTATSSMTASFAQRSSTESMKHTNSLKDMSFESQTVDSDSTQSFEELYMHASGIQNSQTAATQLATGGRSSVSDKFDEQSMTKLSTPPNSNDEMETTTSSDIEIISNPNGDSSSTNSVSRTSPLKMKKQQHDNSHQAIDAALSGVSVGSSCGGGGASKKGHYREPSEISILSEDSQSELDKLVQRICELNGILETREQRLLESERQNARLQDRAHDLQTALDALRMNSSASQHSSDEYTQRLSALEKKFQASIREQEALRTQIKTLKAELLDQIPRSELVSVVGEKDGMIAELRLEGEKLSKEVLQQSNIIKKLRLKEKTADGALRKNKEQIATLTDETERLKKTLHAKEAVERSQIEAVHKMSAEKRKLDEENAQLRSQHEDMQSKVVTLQASCDAARSELQQRARLHTDLTRSAEEAQTAKREQELTRVANEELQLQLAELRVRLRSGEQSAVRREQQLRDENRTLLERVEAAELRAEASTQEVGASTMPLMRQLAALQSTLSQRTSSWQKEEQQLLQKLDDTQTRLKTLECVEATFKERVEILQARCLGLEEKLSQTLMQTEHSKLALQQSQLDGEMQVANLRGQLASATEALSDCNDRLAQSEDLRRSLEETLRDSGKKSELQLHEAANVTDVGGTPTQQRHRELSAAALNEMAALAERGGEEQVARTQSPAASYGMSSLEDAMGGGGADSSIDWHADDLECISNSGRAFPYSMNLNLMGHNTTTLEHLQSLLKQRDGELSHVQWELARLQSERGLLSEELSQLTMEQEILKDKLVTYETLEKSFAELQHRYDALLQMYGEKVERTEELELDLVELKEAYKAQIDELLAQPPAAAPGTAGT